MLVAQPLPVLRETVLWCTVLAAGHAAVLGGVRHLIGMDEIGQAVAVDVKKADASIVIDVGA